MKQRRPKWCKFQLDMLQSEAFQDLNKPTSTIILHVLMQLKWEDTSRKSQKSNWVCSNVRDLILPYATFKKPPYNMGDKTITRAFDSLLAHGFITVREQGGMCKGHFTTYGYSEKWFDWKKGDDPVETRAPFRGRGYTGKNKQT